MYFHYEHDQYEIALTKLDQRFGDVKRLRSHLIAELKLLATTRIGEKTALPQWQKLHDELSYITWPRRF